jgi:spore photoproduct lyase
MIDLIYVERAVADHPRTRRILERFPRAARVPCDRYGEIFNAHAQNFRLQKRRPALILAEKTGDAVLPVPDGYGVGAPRNYYFSTTLNCVYDCRYCFLQGMFRSANYVVFVNDDHFREAIVRAANAEPGRPAFFFSGYDCDSLALEPVTGFAEAFLPFFADLPGAGLELRTKSLNLRPLLDREPLTNVVVAFSMTPEPVSRALEHGVPPLEKRIGALARLQRLGWPVGLRFDPLILHEGFEANYRALFDGVFAAVDPARLHSVSLGPFRLPRGVFNRMVRLLPREPLLAGPLAVRDGLVSYAENVESRLLDFCEDELLRRIPETAYFPCRPRIRSRSVAACSEPSS